MSNGITLKVLGDYGPFSREGKSIGYRVDVGESSYLVDCGSPLFNQIGGHGLNKDIKGLFITHCHDDHKRWFTDLALFCMYAPDLSHKLTLYTTDIINDELKCSSGPALENSLSICRKKIVDIPYENYIDFQKIGPCARYKIVSRDEGRGKTSLYVMGRDGNVAGPDISKIVVSTKTGKPRMLFKDPVCGEWVEPESFYPFSSDIFYEKNKNVLDNGEGGIIEAIKEPVWHGIPGIGIRIKTDKESLVFSSDTVNDEVLWKQLYTEKREQNFDNLSKKEFESSSVIYGDINDYIERAWSEERYKEAVNAFNDAIVIHDVSVRHSVVHTDYEKLENTFLKRDKTILVHSPDRLTSEWVLSNAGKTYVIKDNVFFEKVGDRLYPMNADIYHKEAGRYYVGYKNEKGKYTVYGKDGVLSLSNDFNFNGTPLYNVDLYEDVSGKYFKRLEGEGSAYVERADGRVELVRYTEDGSRGEIIDCHNRDILNVNR